MKFSFALGADAIRQDPILKSDENGEGQLHKMHEFVVAGLAKKDASGKVLEQRWKAREEANNYSYFAGYFHEEGDVKSIVSGIITKNGDLRIINTATLPELRKQGFLEATICEVINHNQQSKNIESTLSSGIKATNFGTIEDVKAVINLANQKDVQEIDPEIEKKFGKVFGKAICSLKDAPDAVSQAICQALVDLDISQKPNFAAAKSFLDKSPQAKLVLEVGSDSGNVNFSPRVEMSRELSEVCSVITENFYSKFKKESPSASFGAASAQAIASKEEAKSL